MTSKNSSKLGMGDDTALDYVIDTVGMTAMVKMISQIVAKGPRTWKHEVVEDVAAIGLSLGEIELRKHFFGSREK